MKRYVYLAGPVTGCTGSEAKDWREAMMTALCDIGLVGVSPIRCEPPVSGRYSPQYADPKYGTARAIASKNLMDVKMCDVTLAYFPKREEAHEIWDTPTPFQPFATMDVVASRKIIPKREPSLGTVAEIAWANALGKPVIVVAEDNFVYEHAVCNACAGWMLRTLDEAVELIEGILGVYTDD